MESTKEILGRTTIEQASTQLTKPAVSSGCSELPLLMKQMKSAYRSAQEISAETATMWLYDWSRASGCVRPHDVQVRAG